MAILQLPYNLSALFNFNEPDTNEGAMESSDEDFFDLFDFLPENTVTTNYLAKGEDRIQSLLRIKTRRTYSMNDFFKLFSRDQFWKKSNSRKDFTEYLIKTYWKKVIDPFVNTLYKDFLAGQITEQEISEKLQEILGFSISLSQCHDEQVTRLVGATGMPTDCIFQMTVFENEYFLVFGKLKPRNRNRKIYLKDDKRKCILWDSYYLATLAVIERIRIEYKRYIHSIRLQYEACLQEYLSDCEDPDLKARLNGNSKYNLDYYLVPTEVFARCGELYFTRFRGVDNSLLKFERGFDYPENEKLLELIKKYYDQHFLTEEISL